MTALGAVYTFTLQTAGGLGQFRLYRPSSCVHLPSAIHSGAILIVCSSGCVILLTELPGMIENERRSITDSLWSGFFPLRLRSCFVHCLLSFRRACSSCSFRVTILVTASPSFIHPRVPRFPIFGGIWKRLCNGCGLLSVTACLPNRQGGISG